MDSYTKIVRRGLSVDKFVNDAVERALKDLESKKTLDARHVA